MTIVTEKVEAILDTLTTLQAKISDRYNTTPDILNTLSMFAANGLDNLISAIEEIEDEVEALEIKVEELESRLEPDLG